MNYLRQVVSYANSMGCCFGCLKEGENQPNEPSERTHLLSDPISNSPALRQAEDDFQYSSSLSNRTKVDEELVKIVQDTATNIIDVAAMDSHNLEQQEYNDRINMYQHRISQLWSNVNHPRLEPTGLLKDVSNPEVMLAAVPVPAEDVAMMQEIVHQAAQALAEIHVEHKEDLVVPFRIP